MVVGLWARSPSRSPRRTPRAPRPRRWQRSTFVSPFASPVKLIGTTSVGFSSTLKLSTLVLQPIQLDAEDPTAKALVAAQRVQIRWRPVGSTGAWTARTNLVTYDAKKHTFNADVGGEDPGHGEGPDLLRAAPDPHRTERRDPARKRSGEQHLDLGTSGFTLELT